MSFVQFRHVIPKSVFCLIILVFFGAFLIAQTPKDEEFKEAQRRNQESQSKYYDKLAENSGSFWIAYSTPITTIIGVIITVLTIGLQNRNIRKLEFEKWENAREDEKYKWEKTRKDDLEKWKRTQQDEVDKWKRLQGDESARRIQEAKAEVKREAKQAAGELIRKVAVAAQSMIWFLYIADNNAIKFSYKLVAEHDERMKNLYAELAASQAILASLDKNLYQKTKRLVTLIYSFDDQIAEKAKIINDREKKTNPAQYKKKVEDLGTLWRRVYDFSKAIPEDFANMLDIQPNE